MIDPLSNATLFIPIAQTFNRNYKLLALLKILFKLEDKLDDKFVYFIIPRERLEEEWDKNLYAIYCNGVKLDRLRAVF